MNKKLIWGKLAILLGLFLAVWGSGATVNDGNGLVNATPYAPDWQTVLLIAGIVLLTAAVAYGLGIIASLLFQVENSRADEKLYLIMCVSVLAGTMALTTPSLVHGLLTMPMITIICSAMICTVTGTILTIKGLPDLGTNQTAP
ncbi:MAG: hypothetical protein SFV17_28285 [Candidatus Obscuribacter sp.]|nr:hypothetical protein [Candidatus Obscuribacter sp.]